MKHGALGVSLEVAVKHYRDGKRDEALRVCLALLNRNPRDAQALYLAGLVELDSGNPGAARERLERAVALVPTSAAFLCNLGLAYAKTRALEKARETLIRALTIDANLVEAWFNLGLVQLDRGDVDDALVHLARAAKKRPSAFPIQRSFARALLRAGQNQDAAERFRTALALSPGSVDTKLELLSLLQRSDTREAEELALRTVEEHPEHAPARREAALLLLRLGCLEEALEHLERAVELDPTAEHAHSRLVFFSMFSPKYDAERVLATARRFHQAHTARQGSERVEFSNDRSPGRRLRIGYVSPDFRDHVQRLFTLPLLREHDRSRFEIVCYSSSQPQDSWTERIQAEADLWREASALDARELAQRIREDGIDVLVDLTMHMDGQRLKVFAEKPAPVQIAWLAYPGTTGVASIDYRITDPHLDPPFAPLPYSEQTLWLPQTFWCYDPASDEPAVNPLPAFQTGYVTFGCLNNFLKTNSGTFELWARVLNALPESRLLLLTPSARARDVARKAFESNGVDPARVEFVGLMWRKDYLATYHRIDIALDCVPYNGHTTSLDSFWMGVPVVSLIGKTIAGRAGLSQAQNLKLPELVAASGDEFVQKAVELARDLPRLSSLRAELRARLKQSPLMDAPNFTRALEAVYRNAWRRWCEA